MTTTLPNIRRPWRKPRFSKTPSYEPSSFIALNILLESLRNGTAAYEEQGLTVISLAGIKERIPKIIVKDLKKVVFQGPAEIGRVQLDASGDVGVDEVFFFDCTLSNSKGSFSPVMSEDNTPKPASTANGDWRGPNATPVGGLVGFFHCDWVDKLDSKVWKFGPKEKVGHKWGAHPVSPFSFWFRHCSFGNSQEHDIYAKHAQCMVIEYCTFNITLGTTLQFASRRGRLEVEGYEGGYTHGNPLHRPSGMGGPLIIRKCVINDKDGDFREAAAITIVGWLGDVLIRNVKIVGSRGAVVIWSDAKKGCYMTDGSYMVDLDKGHAIQPGYEDAPKGYTHGRVVIDGLRFTSNYSDRAAIEIAGVKEAHIRNVKFRCAKPFLNHGFQYGGPCGNGTLTFHDKLDKSVKVRFWVPATEADQSAWEDASPKNHGPRGEYRDWTPVQLESRGGGEL